MPAGGAANISYLVYLAKGRDAEKPAVIVMLDSNKDGDNVRRDLGKNGPQPRKKQIIDPKFIFQLGDISYQKIGVATTSSNEGQHPFNVLKDLVPSPLAVRAARASVKTVYDLANQDIESLNVEKIRRHTQPNSSSLEAINQVLTTIKPGSDLHMDKVLFARTVVDLLPDISEERRRKNNGTLSGIDEFETNLRAVLRHLRSLQVTAEQDVKDKRMRDGFDEKVAAFLGDHVGSIAPRDDAARLLKDIESDLEGYDSERVYISHEIIKLRAAHGPTEELTEPTRVYKAFCAGLERLQGAKQLAFDTARVEVVSRKAPFEIPVPSHLQQSTPDPHNNSDNLLDSMVSKPPVSKTD